MAKFKHNEFGDYKENSLFYQLRNMRKCFRSSALEAFKAIKTINNS